MPQAITFDVNSITLGEALAVERASGRDFTELVKSRVGQLTVAVFVQRLRSSELAPSWEELLSLRVLDARSSTLQSTSDGPSRKSSD